MAFWNGERLRERLGQLVVPFRPEAVDCAAYTLSIGREIYVSPTAEAAAANQQTARQLAEHASFTIPPGQFAFLLTEESVTIPSNAIAFISMKARIKFRGLVNVSGFHVDPGFRGNLIFSVFNAGPSTIHLKQGEDCFLIWYADLNDESTSIKRDAEQTGIPSDLLTRIAGELQSFEGLSAKIKNVEKSLSDRWQGTETTLTSRVHDAERTLTDRVTEVERTLTNRVQTAETDLRDRVHKVERKQTYYQIIAGLALLLIGAVLRGCVPNFASGSGSPIPTSSNAQPPPPPATTSAQPTAATSPGPPAVSSSAPAPTPTPTSPPVASPGSARPRGAGPHPSPSGSP